MYFRVFWVVRNGFSTFLPPSRSTRPVHVHKAKNQRKAGDCRKRKLQKASRETTPLQGRARAARKIQDNKPPPIPSKWRGLRGLAGQPPRPARRGRGRARPGPRRWRPSKPPSAAACRATRWKPRGAPNPRNPRHFDGIEGRRNSVPDGTWTLAQPDERITLKYTTNYLKHPKIRLSLCQALWFSVAGL